MATTAFLVVWREGKGVVSHNWNLKSKFHWQRQESSTWNPESTAWDPAFKTFLDSLHGAIFFFSESTFRLKKSYFPLFTGVNYDVLSFIHRDRYIKKLAFLSPGIGTFAFDTRLGLYQDPPNKKGVHFINTVRKRFELSQQLTFNPVGKVASQYFQTPTLKKFLKASDDLFDIGEDLVKQKLRELKDETEKGLNSSDGPQGNSR